MSYFYLGEITTRQAVRFMTPATSALHSLEDAAKKAEWAAHHVLGAGPVAGKFVCHRRGAVPVPAPGNWTAGALRLPTLRPNPGPVRGLRRPSYRHWRRSRPGPLLPELGRGVL